MPTEPQVARLSDGFNITARDLDRALALARFDPLPRFLIDHARELCWVPGLVDGSRKPVAFRFNLSALARLLECDRAWLSVQCNELVALRVFRREDGGLLLIHKHFPDWLRRIKTAGGERLVPRLTEAQVAWCLEVRETLPRPKGRKVRTVGRAQQFEGPDCWVYPTPPVGCTQHPLLGVPNTPVESTQQFGGSPLRTPLVGGELRESKRDSVLAHAQSAGAPEDDPELASLLEWAGTLGVARDGVAWREWAATQARYHTPRWWVWTLLFRRVVGAARVPSAALLTKVLGDWRAEPAGPDLAPVPRPWELPAPPASPPEAPRVEPESPRPASAIERRRAQQERFRRLAEEAERG